MAKRRGPALYEIIRSRTGDTPPPPDHSGGGDGGSHYHDIPASHWLQPGRQIAIPVGYLLAAIAGGMILLVVVFMIGHEQGRKAERIVHVGDYESAGNADSGSEAAHRPEDPLRTGPASRDRSSPNRTGGDSDSSRSSGRAGSGPTDSSQWGPILSDPRERGREYFAIAETNESGAVRLAEFCRARGLETYVVPGNTAGLRRVIALPGFDPPGRTNPDARRLRDQIYRIGEEWQRQERGGSNLEDAYLILYGGE